MHAALREVLGPSALQSGSYNKPGYLRLDFAWPKALDGATRTTIEEAANRALYRDLPVEVRYMPLAEARRIGALALFGETYDAEVRVVDVGGAWSLAFVATVNQAGIATGRTANGLVKVFAPVLGARGGGSVDMAQGAGGDAANLPAAFDAVRSSLLTPR